MPRRGRTALLVMLAHAVLALALCWDQVLLGRVPYVRDVSFLYVPDFAFLAQSLAQRVWPLWNPLVDGGRPVLYAYLPDVALVALGGPLGAARAEVPLHLWWAALGASTLAHVRGRGTAAVWATGALYAASGYVLACGNIFPLLQGAAWAPWVVAAGLRVLERPGRQAIAALALLGALVSGSMVAELILQAGVFIVVLGARRGERARWARLALAGALSLLLAAPVLAGALAMAADSAREARFTPEVALSWSLHPLELPALVLPRYFGDMHTFSDVGFWGQGVFWHGYPYFISVYLGPIVLMLALLGMSPRLALLALAGLVAALGAHGPLAPAMAAALGALHVRVPSKFLLLTVMAVALMAGDGLERASARRPRAWVLLPGMLLALAGVALALWPDASARVLSRMAHVLSDPRAVFVMRSQWPGAWLRCGALTLLAGVALWRGGRLAGVAALAGVADLVVAGAALDPSAVPSYYRLRAPLRALVDQARREGTFRWFSYGAAAGSPLSWRAEVVARNVDRPLFEIEVQSLLPRTHALLGLEGAFDEDRTGFAPRGSTLSLDERRPARLRDVYARLRLGNVRWVLGYDPLPEDLVEARAEVPQPEVREPLRLFELRDPLPRAFWVPAAEVMTDRGALTARAGSDGFDARRVVLLEQSPPTSTAGAPFEGEAVVSYQRLDPHAVRLDCATPPGFIVVLDGYNPGWRAHDGTGEVPLLRADGRYWALPTAGGSRTIEVRFRPWWRTPSLVLAAVGLAAVVGLAARERRA
jgi:hypothetical protein